MAITEMQTLLLWALLAKPGGASFQKDIRPEVKKPDRDALVKAGLITKEKRGRAGNWLEVTDKGWAWAADHLDAALPKRSTAGSAGHQSKQNRPASAGRPRGEPQVRLPHVTAAQCAGNAGFYKDYWQLS